MKTHYFGKFLLILILALGLSACNNDDQNSRKRHIVIKKIMPPVSTSPEKSSEALHVAKTEKALPSQSDGQEKQTGLTEGPSAKNRMSMIASKDPETASEKEPPKTLNLSPSKPRIAPDTVPEERTGEKTQAPVTSPPPETKKYSVQVGAFKNKNNCDTYALKLEKKGYSPYCITIKKRNHTWHLLKTGQYQTKKQAFDAAERFREQEGNPAIVTYQGTTKKVPQ